jgi:DHA2 family multidrug resistance protein
MDAARTTPPPALLATVFLLTAIEFLQGGVMAFGAAPLMGHFNASPEEYTLVTILYASVAVGVIACHHWLLERLGWRHYLQWSVCLFVVGAGVCASSQGYTSFLLGRVVMALGGAGFMTSSRMVINLIPPSPQRFKGIAAFACALAIGNAIAPWITAQAVNHDLIGGIFVLLAVLAVLAALCGSRCLPSVLVPEEQRSQAGVGLVAALVVFSLLCLYGLQRAVYDFYADFMPLLLCVVCGATGLALLVWHQRHQARPLLVFARLGNLRYLCGLTLFALCYVILGGTNTMLPALMQRALGFGWQVTGAVETVGLLSALLTFVVMARILKVSQGPRKFYVTGFAALAWCGWQLSHLAPGSSLWADVLPALAAYGVFILLVLATTAMQSFAGLQHDAVAFSHGQMLKNMMSQFGLALGIGVATLSLQWRTTEHMLQLSQRFDAGDTRFTRLFEQLSASIGGDVGPQQAARIATAQLSELLGQQAALLASADYFKGMMIAALCLLLVMGTQRVFK